MDDGGAGDDFADAIGAAIAFGLSAASPPLYATRPLRAITVVRINGTKGRRFMTSSLKSVEDKTQTPEGQALSRYATLTTLASPFQGEPSGHGPGVNGRAKWFILQTPRSGTRLRPRPAPTEAPAGSLGSLPCRALCSRHVRGTAGWRRRPGPAARRGPAGRSRWWLVRWRVLGG